MVNPDTDSKAEMDQLIWVTSRSHEPEWAEGGSYQVLRLCRARSWPAGRRRG
ncbi:hypothetical protein [Streptomyces noursei]|uniref:hypothetical protein n=1 Tax=Streptomyces noursei TaxID=1971 RepID=UPI00227D71FB|nr:hypothetical protein [Streptomyces noursei]MCZ1012717.1 hypothetical protein [Streptomyces noursei]